MKKETVKVAEKTRKEKDREKEKTEGHIVQYWTSDTGEKLKFTFFDSDSPDAFKPFIQCYALCFNDKGQIIIGRNPKVLEGRWVLPGGRPEKNETPEQTLRRELMEEVDVTIDKFKFLGAQKVEFLDDKSKTPAYQLRYVVIIKEIKLQTSDPDNGIIWERKFVEPEEVEAHLKWGKILVHLVEKAKEWYNEEMKNQ